MNLLEKAITLATKAHEGQKDKMGNPYIIHPITVMLQMDTEEEMIVAVLHDILEDTHVTTWELKELGFSPKIIGAIEDLTADASETYEEYLQIVKNNPLALKVKLADAGHNLERSRKCLEDITLSPEKRHKFKKLTEKYNKAILTLLGGK